MDPNHVGFAGDEWCPSRIPFGKFKGRLYQKAEVDAEVQSWLEWLTQGGCPPRLTTTQLPPAAFP